MGQISIIWDRYLEKEETVLQETQEPEVRETVKQELPAPQGIGMAVAFDWGLAVQILLTPFVFTFFSQSNPIKSSGLNPLVGTILLFIVALLATGALVFFGEMVRSGRNWTRWIQIAVNTLLTVAGLVSIINLYHSISVGNFWPVVTEVILLIFSPLIAWRLSRPASARWFQLVAAADARKRHGGRWVWFIALWAIAGGVLQTLAAMR
jgi:ACR3 family arsenite efflux pump ArsB